MDPVLTSGNIEYERAVSERSELSARVEYREYGNTGNTRNTGYPTLPGSVLFGPSGPNKRLFWPKVASFAGYASYPGSRVFPVFRVFRVFPVFLKTAGCCTFGVSLLLLESRL